MKIFKSVMSFIKSLFIKQIDNKTEEDDLIEPSKNLVCLTCMRKYYGATIEPHAGQMEYGNCELCNAEGNMIIYYQFIPPWNTEKEFNL